MSGQKNERSGLLSRRTAVAFDELQQEMLFMLYIAVFLCRVHC